MRGKEILSTLNHRLDRIGSVQVDGREGDRAHQEVLVGIVETGNDRTSLKVDAKIRFLTQRKQVVVATDRNDSVVFDQDRLCEHVAVLIDVSVVEQRFHGLPQLVLWYEPIDQVCGSRNQ